VNWSSPTAAAADRHEVARRDGRVDHGIHDICGDCAGRVLADADPDGVTADEVALVAGVVLATAACTVGRLWRFAGLAVTVVHELGHALTALALGGQVRRVHLTADTAGQTSFALPVRAGRARRAVVTLAGYPAPGLAGLAGAWLLAAGEARSWLGLVTLLLVVLLVLWVRNPWGVGSVLLGAVGLGWLAVKGSPGVVTAAGAGLAALLLVGGWRAAALHATRDGRGWARSPTGVVSDSVAAGQLLLLPAVVWRGLFLAVSTATMLAGGWLLLNVLR
jgi:hypothetical protein